MYLMLILNLYLHLRAQINEISWALHDAGSWEVEWLGNVSSMARG